MLSSWYCPLCQHETKWQLPLPLVFAFFGIGPVCWAGKTISQTCLNFDKPQPSTQNENENEMKVLQVGLGQREMQLIWTPKLINISWRQTLEKLSLKRRKKERRRNRTTTFFQPFGTYLPQVNNKAARGLRIICTQRWKQTCCSTCHLPHATALV